MNEDKVRRIVREEMKGRTEERTVKVKLNTDGSALRETMEAAKRRMDELRHSQVHVVVTRGSGMSDEQALDSADQTAQSIASRSGLTRLSRMRVTRSSSQGSRGEWIRIVEVLYAAAK